MEERQEPYLISNGRISHHLLQEQRFFKIGTQAVSWIILMEHNLNRPLQRLI